MSLTFDEIAEVHRAWEDMDERLNRLIGFNPATSNHYGVIQLYNQRINLSTSDERIIEIRSKYLEWKNKVLDVFVRNSVFYSTEELNKLFRVDCMYGTLYFLGSPVDIYGEFEPTLERIKRYIEKEYTEQYN
ncbi:MAG TPA: hypothetical protein PLS05_06930 [Clostridia bacterium]|nr:hypothetical protein [Clostridia bacterium]HOL61586.1 hypothetical protein [Clostridia bacterium]HPO54204.1 hypothetical protein [Clostridia bacterium]